MSGTNLWSSIVRNRIVKTLLIGAALSWAPIPGHSQQYDYLVSHQLALTNAVATVKGSPTSLIWYSCNNLSNAQVIVEFFDAATAGAVTLGTTAPTRFISIATLVQSGVAALTPPFSVVNGLQVAAVTAFNGSSAPSKAIDCEFAFR